MPTYVARKPGYPPDYQPVTTGFYPDTINKRVALAYSKWGFVIYRATYEDDALWKKFITLLKDNWNHHLRLGDPDGALASDLLWTVIEDRKSLDSASKDEVRARFLEWVAARSVERDGPGADMPWVARECPRFRYCIYVDRACLDSMTARWGWDPDAEKKYRWFLSGEVVIIDGTHGYHDVPEDPSALNDRAEYKVDDDEENFVEEEYVPIEGNTAWNVGWQYAPAGTLISRYEALQFQGTDWETWEMVYRRHRPLGGPKTGRDEPLSSVDLSEGATQGGAQGGN